VTSATRASTTIAILAAAVWLGGMLALGAVVAPVVFHTVPAPTSADAMTVIFRRFDKIAMGCAVVVLAVEGWRARSGRATRLDWARIACGAGAAGLAVWQGMVLSPRIEALHVAGAVRGSGALGAELESLHKVAETEAKAQLALVVALVVLHVFTVARTPASLREGARRASVKP